MMQFETGNGIALCRSCHSEPHAAFNGRPDLQLPMDAQAGENIDLLASLFAALCEDARRRSLASDSYYYVSNSALRTFKNFQGISPDLPFPGSRVEQAYLIWRQTPRAVLKYLLEANGIALPPNLIQLGPITALRAAGPRR
jgi:hypothetical protein